MFRELKGLPNSRQKSPHGVSRGICRLCLGLDADEEALKHILGAFDAHVLCADCPRVILHAWQEDLCCCVFAQMILQTRVQSAKEGITSGYVCGYGNVECRTSLCLASGDPPDLLTLVAAVLYERGSRGMRMTQA